MKSVWKQPIAALALINAGVALIAFLKDIMLAAYTGTSLYADALTIAFFLPDSIGNNMLAAAISVASVPVFSRLAAKDQMGRLSEIVRMSTMIFLAAAFLILVLGYLFSSVIIESFGGNRGGQELIATTLPLLKLLLPTVMMFIAIAIGTAVLQTLNQFFVPAMAPLLNNLILLAGVVYCLTVGVPIDDGITGIAVIIMIGITLMALWIARASQLSLREATLAGIKNSLPIKSPRVTEWKELLHLFYPYVIILLSAQSIYLVERYLLATLDTGAAAALNYAFRLSQFPIWVFVAAVSVVILPSLSRYLALERRNDAHVEMSKAFRSVILIVLPIMLFLFVLREPMTVALFQRGAFDERSVGLTTGILEGYSLTIFSQAISLICLRYFLALRQLKAVLLVYLFSALITVGLDIAWVDQMGVRAIGYGAMVGALINALLLLGMYSRSVSLRFKDTLSHFYLYLAVLLPPVVLLPFLLGLWKFLPKYGNGYAILFIILSGFLYISVYLLSMKRFTPSMLLSLTSLMRKG